MKIKSYITALLFGVSLTSCDSYMDINQDPNSPSEGNITTGIALPAAEGSLMSTYDNLLHITGGYYAQYYAQTFGTSNYLDYSQFSMSSTRSATTYRQLNQRALKNLEVVRQKASAAGEWGSYLAATTLRAFTYQVLVDCYGEVPFTEALDEKKLSPKYDDGQLIYDSLIVELNDALSKVDASDKVATNILYKGQSADNWIKFANALKLRILMRESGVKDVKAELAKLVAENNFPTKDVAYQGIWKDESGQANPFYQEEFASYFGATQENVVANLALINTMQQKDAEGNVTYLDPRLSVMFAKNSSGNYTGGISGSNFSTSTSFKASYWCRPLAHFDDPVYMITVAETEFFLAEYEARYGNAANAKIHYDNAIRASFATMGVEGADDYITRFPYDAANSAKSIGQAKWVALAGVNPFEGWCEVRRLNYPTFGTVQGSDLYNEQTDDSYKPNSLPANTLYTPIKVYNEIGKDKLIERWPYAENSSSRNANAPKFPGYTSPVFWGK